VRPLLSNAPPEEEVVPVPFALTSPLCLNRLFFRSLPPSSLLPIPNTLFRRPAPLWPPRLRRGVFLETFFCPGRQLYSMKLDLLALVSIRGLSPLRDCPESTFRANHFPPSLMSAVVTSTRSGVYYTFRRSSSFSPLERRSASISVCHCARLPLRRCLAARCDSRLQTTTLPFPAQRKLSFFFHRGCLFRSLHTSHRPCGFPVSPVFVGFNHLKRFVAASPWLFSHALFFVGTFAGRPSCPLRSPRWAQESFRPLGLRLLSSAAAPVLPPAPTRTVLFFPAPRPRSALQCSSRPLTDFCCILVAHPPLACICLAFPMSLTLTTQLAYFPTTASPSVECKPVYSPPPSLFSEHVFSLTAFLRLPRYVFFGAPSRSCMFLFSPLFLTA